MPLAVPYFYRRFTEVLEVLHNPLSRKLRAIPFKIRLRKKFGKISGTLLPRGHVIDQVNNAPSWVKEIGDRNEIIKGSRTEKVGVKVRPDQIAAVKLIILQGIAAEC